MKVIIKNWLAAHSTAVARLTNMNFPTLLSLVFVFGSSSFVQANTDVFDPNNQTIEYVAKTHEPDQEMLEEIFPEEYIKAHLGVKNFDEVAAEVSSGGTRDRGVHLCMGIFVLFTLLLWLYTQSVYTCTCADHYLRFKI